MYKRLLAFAALVAASQWSAPPAWAAAAGSVQFIPSDGETVDLTSEFSKGTAASPFQYTLKKSGTLDVGAGTWYVKLVINGPEVTLDGAGSDSTVLSGGGKERVILVEDDVTLTLSDVTLTDGDVEFQRYDKWGGALIRIQDDAQVKATDCSFTNGEATNGGAIFVNGGSLDVSDSHFSGSRATGMGGAISVDSGDAVVTRSSFTDNSSEDAKGDAIYIGEDAPFRAEETRFKGTSLYRDLDDDEFEVVSFDELEVVTCTDIRCEPSYRALFIAGDDTVTDLTQVFGEGTASKPAEVELTEDGVLQVASETFYVRLRILKATVVVTPRDEGARPVLSGGDTVRVLTTDSADVTLRGVVLSEGRQESGVGGAISAKASTVVLDDCVVADSYAGEGGGLALVGASTVTISNSTFRDNTAKGPKGTGIKVLHQDAILNVATTVFYGNGIKYKGVATVYPDATEVVCTDLTCEAVDDQIPFFDDDGMITNYGPIFAAGTASAPAQHTFSRSGALSLPEGSWYVALVVEGATVTIQGLGADVSALDGGGSTRILWATDNANLQLDGLSLTNGSAWNTGYDKWGGGALRIESGSAVAVDKCIFSNNKATNGGAIYLFAGSLDIAGTTFTDNEATGGDGTALYASSGKDLDIEKSNFVGETVYAEGEERDLGERATLVCDRDGCS